MQQKAIVLGFAFNNHLQINKEEFLWVEDKFIKVTKNEMNKC